MNIKIGLCIFFACVIVFTGGVLQAEENNLWEFLKAGELAVNLRSYFIDRHFNVGETQKSMAVGGSVKYETSPWHGFSIGLAGYTSQGLIFTDPEEGGGGILRAGQEGYTVLGQAYLQGEIKKTKLCLYRQELDTPFINPFDVKMTPVTFEAYTFETQAITNLTFVASHITKIKTWVGTKFISMSEAAGFPDTNEPVTLAGMIFTPAKPYKFQIWGYYCHEFMNVVYFQGDANWNLTKELLLTWSCQAIHQRDVGKALEGNFNTGMIGTQGGIGWMGLNFSLGFTVADRDHDIVNPWGSYPGYTSIMEEDSDLAGEKSWVVGLAYDFEKIGIKGLSAYSYHTQAYMPPGGWFSSPDQREADITVDYRFSGKLKGLWLRLRAAFVDYSFDVDREDYSDYRVIINYNF